MNYEINKKLAMDLLDVALKNDHLLFYVAGQDPYSIKIQNENGNRSSSVAFTMEAIYEKHKTDPSLMIDKKVYEILERAVSNLTDQDVLMFIINVIQYQLSAEQSNRASFKIDCKTLLEKLKNHLIVNKDYFEENFVDEMNRKNNSIVSEYGPKMG